MQIEKYQLQRGYPYQLAVPSDSRFVCLSENWGNVYIHYAGTPLAPHETREIFVYDDSEILGDPGTGYALDHLGTIQTADGMMWHVFDRKIEQ